MAREGGSDLREQLKLVQKKLFSSIFGDFMVWGNVFKVRKVLMGYPMHSETNHKKIFS